MPNRPPRAVAPKKDSFASRSGLRPSSPLDDDNPLNAALEQEILAEKMGTYTRLLKRLEEALAALREFERARVDLPLTADPHPSRQRRASSTTGSGLREGGLTGRRAFALASPAAPAAGSETEQSGNTASEKEKLLDDAGQALWHVIIQRDLCGFRRHDLFYREYKVPAAVRLRMGLLPARDGK
jgi:hypothetical protein